MEVLKLKLDFRFKIDYIKKRLNKMGKRRPSNMSSRQLELIKEPPNIVQSIYDANRKESTVKQDSYKLESIELLFCQLKKLASENSENGIPGILQYENSQTFLRSAPKESIDLLFAKYVRGNWYIKAFNIIN